MMFKRIRIFFKYSILFYSGFLVMFIPKCSFLPYCNRSKLDENVVQTFQRVIAVEDSILADELLEEDPEKTQDEH